MSPEENPQPSLFDAGPAGAPAQDAPTPEPPAPENAPEQTGGEPPAQDAPAGAPGEVSVSADQIEKLMFSIIDSRYRCNKPLIVTTNLKLDELKRPPDLAHARIYDRILERCAPILFAGKNFREDNAASTKAAARRIVSPDNQRKH